jgi:hypothetical protein
MNFKKELTLLRQYFFKKVKYNWKVILSLIILVIFLFLLYYFIDMPFFNI